MDSIDQSEVLAFLANPANHDLQHGEVTRIRTHLAEIFLAGERVFKVKRAARYAFVDFSTLAARRAACEAEVRLNRRTAPDIYLGVVAIRRAENGQLMLDELQQTKNGIPVEWAVVIRRFDERLTLDRMADEGALRPAWINALIDSMVSLHDSAEVHGAPYGGSAGLRKVIDENAADMAAIPNIFASDRTTALIGAQRKRLAIHADLLDARRDAGQVRRCHGDLHLGNIVLWHDRPMPFDCIEFSDDIAIIDVAYDLAFLLMDLEVRGLRPLAARALSRYFCRRGGVEGLAVLPLMLALRAGVRAKVTAMAIGVCEDAAEAAHLAGQVERFMTAAEGFLAPGGRPCLIAVGGLSGSGKTTLAAALAPDLGRAPGALVLRSDVVRKRLAGVMPEQRLPETAYTPETSRRVYEALMKEAGTALAAGHGVVVDAVFAQPEERRAVESVARTAGADFRGIWLEAPAATLRDRVANRMGDASDATADVVTRQLSAATGAITWSRLDASGGSETILRAAKSLLGSSQESGLPAAWQQ